jgi:ankyrin repeat protein
MQHAGDGVADAFLAAHGFAAGAVNAVDPGGLTPLMHAARLGLADMARALIAAGARVDASTGDGNQALWLACVSDEPAAVAALIEAGADLDHINATGATALIYAASAGKARALAVLLDAGADLAPEVAGMTALDMASTIECLRLLRAADRKARAHG